MAGGAQKYEQLHMHGLIKGVDTKMQKINEVPVEFYVEELISQEQDDRVLFTKRRKIVQGKLPKRKKKKKNTQADIRLDPMKLFKL